MAAANERVRTAEDRLQDFRNELENRRVRIHGP